MSAWPKTNYCDSLSDRNMIKSDIPFGAVFISLGYLEIYYILSQGLELGIELGIMMQKIHYKKDFITISYNTFKIEI